MREPWLGARGLTRERRHKNYISQCKLLMMQAGCNRFYVMRLPQRGLSFDRITYHAKVRPGQRPSHIYSERLSPTSQVPLCIAACMLTCQRRPRSAEMVASRADHLLHLRRSRSAWAPSSPRHGSWRWRRPAAACRRGRGPWTCAPSASRTAAL